MSIIGARKKKLVKLWVELDIAIDEAGDAYGLVNDVLDAGVLRDAINEHIFDGSGLFNVTSAVCHSEDPATAVRDALKKLFELVDDVRDNSDGLYPSADPGCIECTRGVTPDRLNTGLCAYHAAKALLAGQK